MPLGCKVWFISAPTIYEQAKAAPRLAVGIFMGYRMAPGGRFGGQYLVVDRDDFNGVSLDMKTRHTKFKFHEHHVEKVVLPPEENGSKFVFPLKAKYDLANDEIEGRDNPARAAAQPFPDQGVPPPGTDPASMGESVIGPLHRGMYKRDRLGKKYPVDMGRPRLLQYVSQSPIQTGRDY